MMGAVNTVVRVGDRLVGENTDGKGFMRALSQDAKVDPKGKKVLVLGAGGAARAADENAALRSVNRRPTACRRWASARHRSSGAREREALGVLEDDVERELVRSRVLAADDVGQIGDRDAIHVILPVRW